MVNENQVEEVKETQEVKPVVDIDFDLPIDESAPKAKPRVFMAPGESACISCEG